MVFQSAKYPEQPLEQQTQQRTKNSKIDEITQQRGYKKYAGMRRPLPRRCYHRNDSLHKPDKRPRIKGAIVRVYAMKKLPHPKTKARDDSNPNGLPLLHSGPAKFHVIPVSLADREHLSLPARWFAEANNQGSS